MKKLRSAYKRDEAKGVKRVVVRLDKVMQEAAANAQARHGSYAPSLSALLRRGLTLACQELNRRAPRGGF